MICDEGSIESSEMAVAKLYSAPISLEVGGNLGISFSRAQMEHIDIVVGGDLLSIAQSGMGCIGIAGCVWNCALYNIDFLSHLCGNGYDFGGSICDLATGTGVVGLAYAFLIKEKMNVQTDIVFTDKSLTACYHDNIDDMLATLDKRGNHIINLTSVEFDWLDKDIPESLSRHFTTILCSDVIYEPVVSKALLVLLRRLSFDRMILVYQRRNDSKERFFFDELVTFCDLAIAAPPPVPIADASTGVWGAFPLINITAAEAAGMYVIFVTPRKTQ